jgi:putative hydrolase of the HAD superfamily
MSAKSIKALFWDVGGVLLSNAWDHSERGRAVEQFRLNSNDFEERHKAAVVAFEEGKLTLDEYLDRTVFYTKRDFTRDSFKQFMFSLSQPKPQVLELARDLASRYLMVTINNESRELNEYRIRHFGLAQIFDLFITSCYVGLRKPDVPIYRLALDLLQKSPDECYFIDDRPENIQGAKQAGLHAVLMRDVAQLKKDLQLLGIAA